MSRKNITELRKRIQFIRELNGLNKTQFAEKLGVSGGYITLLESGKKTELSKALAKLISLVFRVNEEWLLTCEGALYSQEEERHTTEKPVATSVAPKNPDELICTGQLLKILRGRNSANVTAIKTNLHAFALTADINVPDDDNGDKQAELQAAEEEAPYGKKNNHS